jgi:sugar phosphate isomerase/epimerase
MKYGAQLYSLREQGKTPAEIREIFRRMKEMGYQMVQVSGLGPIDPYELRDISQEFGLPIPITHTPLPRLQEELDEVIREHRIFGCPVIGLGAMPKPMRDGTAATFLKFMADMDEISKKIRDVVQERDSLTGFFAGKRRKELEKQREALYAQDDKVLNEIRTLIDEEEKQQAERHIQ